MNDSDFLRMEDFESFLIEKVMLTSMRTLTVIALLTVLAFLKEFNQMEETRAEIWHESRTQSHQRGSLLQDSREATKLQQYGVGRDFALEKPLRLSW